MCLKNICSLAWVFIGLRNFSMQSLVLEDNLCGKFFLLQLHPVLLEEVFD